MNIAYLPLDIWVPISNHLAVRDILALRASCKLLRGLMDERSVWHGALVDILSVIHIPGVREALYSMSSEELRQRAIRMTRLDRRWYQGSMMLGKVRRHHCESNAYRVQFIQGGEWVVMMFSNGSLQLSRTQNLEKPVICVQSSTPGWPDAHFEMGISISSQLVNLIHVTEKRWNIGYTNIRIYRVDVSKPTLNIEMEMRIPQIIEPISLHCDLLAVPWMENTSGQMKILIASLAHEQVNKKVVMDLGIRSEESHNFTIHILSQRLLLLARPIDFFLFAIPELEQVDNSGEPLVIPVQPMWTYSHHVQPVRGRPSLSPLPYSDVNQHGGKVAILTGKFIYILSAFERPEDCHVVHYSLSPNVRYVPFRCSMGSRHAVWTTEQTVKPFLGLQTCAYFTMPEGCIGVHRLGHVGQMGVQLRPLQLPIQNGDIADVCWDEESCRLCVLISRPHGGAVMNRVLVVEL